TSKRDGSILDFLTKKMKSTTLFSTEEIELTEVSTISEDKTDEASSLIQNAPVIDLLNPSNINDLPENCDESENESEFLVILINHRIQINKYHHNKQQIYLYLIDLLKSE
ncbi:unnamed protein product, partial [Rotaria magnacalcarata]